MIINEIGFILLYLCVLVFKKWFKVVDKIYVNYLKSPSV